MEKTLNKIFEEIFAKWQLKEEHLLEDAKLEPIDVDLLSYSYIDNGRADISTDVLKTPIEFESKKIIGYCLINKYLYGRESHTRKKYTIKFYYDENENNT